MAGMRIGVVGAGIIGLAVARRLAELRPEATVTVLEKEDEVALHQTGRNSGVVHAGIYYPPGSLKAELCRRGVGLLQAYCAEREIPLVECGKLVVALDESQLERLRELERRATANGVPGVRWVEGDALRELEPHAAGIAGLHSPTTGITDYRAVAQAFADDVRAAGGSVRLGTEVHSIETRQATARVATADDELEFDMLVICAGLQSDRSHDSRATSTSRRSSRSAASTSGSPDEREQLIRGLLYPVPDPAYPFLGVHFTRRVHGGVDVGRMLSSRSPREGYRRRDVRLGDLAETFRARGFRALARKHWRMGAHELRGSLSKQAFAAEARRYVPDVTAADLVPAPAGVRAQAVDPDGSLVDDFRINRLGPVTAVRNAPPPGPRRAWRSPSTSRNSALTN